MLILSNVQMCRNSKRIRYALYSNTVNIVSALNFRTTKETECRLIEERNKRERGDAII